VQSDAPFYRESDHDDLGYGAVSGVMPGPSARADGLSRTLRRLPLVGPPSRRYGVAVKPSTYTA
jgi:hypothetical protein